MLLVTLVDPHLTCGQDPRSGLCVLAEVIEFANRAVALAAYDDPDYRQALRRLSNGAERVLRIIEGA